MLRAGDPRIQSVRVLGFEDSIQHSNLSKEGALACLRGGSEGNKPIKRGLHRFRD